MSVSDSGSILTDLPLCAKSDLTECRTNMYIPCRNFSHYAFPALSLFIIVLPFILQLQEFALNSKETSWYFTLVTLLKLLSMSVMELSVWRCSFWPTNSRKATFPPSLSPACWISVYYCTYHAKVLLFSSVCHLWFMVNFIRLEILISLQIIHA